MKQCNGFSTYIVTVITQNIIQIFISLTIITFSFKKWLPICYISCCLVAVFSFMKSCCPWKKNNNTRPCIPFFLDDLVVLYKDEASPVKISFSLYCPLKTRITIHFFNKKNYRGKERRELYRGKEGENVELYDAIAAGILSLSFLWWWFESRGLLGSNLADGLRRPVALRFLHTKIELVWTRLKNKRFHVYLKKKL